MELDVLRKRLLWRASHRGMKEMDLMLGGFTRAHIAEMTEAELQELEAIVSLPDQDLLSWVVSQSEVPERHRSATLMRLLAYRP
jgi:antitoxin CptB